MTITLTIKGRVPSKKNSKQIIPVRGRSIIISSKEYIKWEAGAAYTLGIQAERQGIKSPIIQASVVIEIMFPDLRTADMTNKAESIMDALVRGGVLKDDSWRVVNSLGLLALGADKELSGAKIIITTMG